MKTLLIISALIISSQVKAFDKVDMSDLTSLDFSKDAQESCSTENLIKNDTTKTYAKKAIRINTIHNAVVVIAKDLKVNPCIILSMIATESSFNGTKDSGLGAKGLIQVMPVTKNYILNKLITKKETKVKASNYVLAKRTQAMSLISKKTYKSILAKMKNSHLSSSEVENIVLGSYYVAYLMNKFDNNVDHTIMAYNMGSGWVNRNLNAKVAIGNNNKHLDKVKKAMVLVSLN